MLILINKQELTKDQIQRMKYNEKNNIKEFFMNNDNKINHKNFVKIAKATRDKIQSSFILYKKNYISDNNENKKKKRRSILDENDPFGFEYQRQENFECVRRQIEFIIEVGLNNNLNCEIILIEYNNEGKINFFKLKCGEDNIQKNIMFVEKWYNKTLLIKGDKFKIFDY